MGGDLESRCVGGVCGTGVAMRHHSHRTHTSVSTEEFVGRTPQWTHYLLTGSDSHGTTPTRGDNTTQSSAPEDGHIVARNMLSNL